MTCLAEFCETLSSQVGWTLGCLSANPTLFDIHKGPMFSQNDKYMTVDKRDSHPNTQLL